MIRFFSASAIIVALQILLGAAALAETGTASWYGNEHHGRRTASGERFDQNALTAAHRTLPFGTQVLVRNMRNGREVVVRITDRGPARRTGRVIDLSKAAAAELGMVLAGVARVSIEALRPADSTRLGDAEETSP